MNPIKKSETRSLNKPGSTIKPLSQPSPNPTPKPDKS